VTFRKKLIEVALPLDAINKAAAREKSIRHGHPSTLHLWWARRPLAAARAVIFAQMVDDPSANPDLFPTQEAQEQERQRLFQIIEELVQWENTTNEEVLERAREEIWKCWRRACEARREWRESRKESLSAEEFKRDEALFDPDRLPAFHDPFAGGGSLPLEAQRLGLKAYASDLNPVAVLINKAMIEIPPRFANKPPVNLASRTQDLGLRGGAGGTALSGTDSLAQSDGLGERGLWVGAAVAAGGNVRHEIADHASGSVGTGEHRGGLDQGVRERTGAVSGDRPRLAGRDRNPSDAVRGNRLVFGAEDSQDTQFDHRGGKDAQHPAPQTAQSSLSPTSYLLFARDWKGAQGLAEDVRFYGQWMRDEAERRIGHLYPKVEVTAEMAKERSDLKPLVGKKLTVIAWLWARTVRSPNPAFRDVDVPLASTFMLSTKAGKEAYVEPVVEKGGYRFKVKVGKPADPEAAKRGSKSGGSHSSFLCLMSGTPMPFEYLRSESRAGRMGARLMAIVAEGERGRVYLPPTPEHEAAARQAKPEWKPEVAICHWPGRTNVVEYGLTTFGDLFTPRQLVALTTFSDLVGEAMERVKRDALAAGLPDDPTPLRDGGTGATAYAEAVGVYLAFALNKVADRGSSLGRWDPTPTQSGIINTFSRQALPMTWDFAESNPLGDASGNYVSACELVGKALLAAPRYVVQGHATQGDASTQSLSANKIISTDPPYYDNIGYADLSDFFYVWLRRSLRSVFPELFSTLAVPKAEELVATPYRHGSKEKAEQFFLDGMTQAMHRLAEQAHPAFPVTIYYAFKQSETESAEGTASTGWETFLDAVIRAGFAISGTWPMRTENSSRMIGQGTNALASSIVLVCRPRAANAPIATRREFVTALKAELPQALAHLQRSNIAPVDLAQAAIGPGMAVYTRYARVLDAEGRPVSVREALALINQILDEVLAEQEGDFDADSRWAIAWFEQFGFAEGEFGIAETLSKAKNTSVGGMALAGIIESKRGKVRLLQPDELPEDWDPATDSRLTVWEMVHHLVRVLEAGGESAAAALLAKLGARAETARELAYRLYTVAERKKRAQEALRYNALVQSWPEIARLAREAGTRRAEQTSLFEGERR
jgi:putative DNA methylase